MREKTFTILMALLLIALMASLLIAGIAFASDAQRKWASGQLTSKQSLATQASTVFGIEMIPTEDDGYITVYDYAGSSVLQLQSEKVIAEVTSATQYDAKYRDYGEGLKAYKGLYVDVNNATAIVYYH